MIAWRTRRPPVVRADRMRLLEVLQNLIENAVKFRREDVVLRIEIDARVEGDEVICRVRDNGIGVQPQFHEKVFGRKPRGKVVHLPHWKPPDAGGQGIVLAVIGDAQRALKVDAHAGVIVDVGETDGE